MLRTLSRTFVCCVVLALAGCGGGEEEPRDSIENVRPPLLSGERAGRSGTLEQTACTLVSSADVQDALGLGGGYRLTARRNDSLDLSSRDWSGGPTELVRLSIDAARGLGDAARRRAAVRIARLTFRGLD